MAMLRHFIETVIPPVESLRRIIECFGIPAYWQEEAHCLPSAWCEKSISEAKRLRHLGNQSYGLANFDDALMYYSQSIANAPNDSEELALSYGNRSAILLLQKNYELCLLDSNRALGGSLPQSARQKLLQRKSVCWEKLQEQSSSQAVKPSNQERAKFRGYERKLCYISRVNIDDQDMMIDHSLTDDPIWNSRFCNTQLQNVSSKIEMRSGGLKGRHLVATCDIAPGELIAIDEIYSLNVSACKKHEYCSYCHFRCEALIPCLCCTWEMYCCFDCREKALNSYHEMEHKILPLWGNVPALVREKRLLILRVFLKGTKQGSELTNLMNDPKVYEAIEKKSFHPEAHYSMQDYITLLNSSWNYHNDILHTTNQDAMKHALAIFAGLHYALFFGNESKQIQFSAHGLKDEELFSVLLLVHHGLSVTCHGHILNAFLFESLGKNLKLRVNDIGVGWGTWETFMNHSCNPNTLHVMNRRFVLWCSTRLIKAGEQVSTAYGGVSFCKYAREERQKALMSKYSLECYCIACVEDWPLFESLIYKSNNYYSAKRKMMTRIDQIQDRLLKKYSNYAIGEDELKVAIEMYSAYQEYVKEPSPILNLCSQIIARCMKAKGNSYFSQKFKASLS